MPPDAPITLLLKLPPLLQAAVRHVIADEAGFLEPAPGAPTGLAPDVTVLALGTAADLPQLTEALRAGAKAVLALVLVPDTTLMDEAVMAGARGVVSLTDTPDVLLKAIEKVHQGQLWIDRGATGRLFVQLARRQTPPPQNPESLRIASLTQRERDAIAALMADASAPGKKLATRMQISDRTLRNHFTAIYDKLGVTNRVDLYAFAQRHRLFEDNTGG